MFRRKTGGRGPFFWLSVSSGIVIMAFIILPLIQMFVSPSAEMLSQSIHDRDVVHSIWLSIYTAGLAALISFFFGTPLAYLLARYDFRGKRIVEGIIDLPIAIRPEDIVISRQILSSSVQNSFRGVVTAIVDRGFYYEVHAKTGGVSFTSIITKSSLIELGLQESADIVISFKAASVHFF